MTIHRLHTIKKEFPELLEQSKGIISIACRKAGIERKTYYNWRNKDPAFAAKCDDALELTADNVELALLNKIEEGNIIAIIFYCKTKLKHRGYTERIERIQVEAPVPNISERDEEIIERALQRRMAALKDKEDGNSSAAARTAFP